MNWNRFGASAFLVVAFILGCVANHRLDEMTAHAQEPEFSPLVSYGASGCDFTAHPSRDCHVQLLRVWIESHCVAVLPENLHGVGNSEWQLKLRCSEEIK